MFMGAMRDKGKDVNFFIGNTPEILEKTGGTAREGVAGFYDPDSNTVFVNTDAETPSFTLFHELFHPTERWSAMRKELDADTGETVKSDPLQDIQTDLAQTIFGTYGPDGEVIQPGLYSKEDMLSFADQYNSRLYPDLSTEIKEVKAAIEAEKKKTLPEIDGIEPPETPEMRLLNRELEELQTRQEGNQKELAAFDALPDATKRDYMARELMSDYFAMFGESARHGIIRKARNITLKKDYFKDKFLGMNIDRLKMATLGNLRKLLEGAGVEFDLAGNPRGEMTATSALFKDPETGRELVMSPQIEHLLAQYITEKDKLVNRVSETDDVGGSEITLNAKDVLKKNPDGTPKIPEAEIKRWASSGWLKTDKEGNVLNSTGGKWQPGQRPAFTTARERTRMDKNRVAALVTALTPVTEKIAEGDPGSLTVKARETADGGTNFRGSYFDEQQMDAIMATPDDVIHPDLKSVIKTMNDAIKEGKGAPFLADYWKAITGRGYDSKARMKVQLFTPIGMQISSAGNFNATVFNIGYFENKINRWLGQSGKKKFWSDWADADGRVDVDSFRTDMMELLKTHYENDPSKKFPEGMKKEKLYSFLGVKPEDLSRKDWNRAAKDFKLFISLRFDRMKDVTRGMGDNFPVNYYKAKQRFMPATAEPRPAQDKLGFFSRVEQVASGNKIPNRGTGEQMLATIAKQPGVKQEELAWLGLEDFLRGKKQVTKDELVEFIRENDVQLEETMLTETPPDDIRSELVSDYVDQESDQYQILYDEDEKSYLTYDPNGEPMYMFGGDLVKHADPDGAMDDLKFKIEESANRMTDGELMQQLGRENKYQEGQPARYQEYQLPGAEPGSYRELLLRLPGGGKEKITFDEMLRSPEYKQFLADHDAIEMSPQKERDVYDAYLNDRYLGEYENIFPDIAGNFTSSHFSEPNILSHVRFNDRTGPDGEKILFLEELQSDWHQEGRKRGYAKDSGRPGVPDAPFKSSWHELTLKRMLRYAAENGYDKLAFIDGKETADRYDLSKRVDKVAISDDETGNLTITADDSLIASDVEPNQLERYVGKEVAQRALQSIEDTSPDMSGIRTTVLTDSDLKVGGQWAFNLYDRMIPQFLNKYGKKFGAKVEDFSTSIPDEPFLPRDSTFKAIDITPQMRGEEGVLGGQARFMPAERNDRKNRVSTRLPTAVAATEDPLASTLLIDSAAVFNLPPEKQKVMAGIITKYPNIRTSSKNLQPVADELKQQSIDNLLWLHDKVPADIRKRSKLWYDGARKITNGYTKEFQITNPAGAGVLAVLSPGKDWFMNVSLAERIIDTVQNKVGKPIDAKMMNQAKFRLEGNAALMNEVKKMVGKKYNNLTPLQKSIWIRMYDEAYNSPNYEIISPEGRKVGLVKKNDGTNANVAHQSFPFIQKAIAVLDDPSRENISGQLGGAHKIRNFYNNILLPKIAKEDVTIDTHAVAAALLRPFAQKSTEVTHNFGAGMPGSSITGAQGTYGIYADAYREAARQRGILPREMQSITWEAVRGLFPNTMKTEKNKALADAIWTDYKRGRKTIDEARKEIEKLFGGIDAPDWYR